MVFSVVYCLFFRTKSRQWHVYQDLLSPINRNNQPQHVILRGDNRAEVFCADADYNFYLEKLKLACVKHGCTVHAYVLMTNHVHLLMTPHLEQSLGKAMQMLWRYYNQWSQTRLIYSF